MTFRSRFRHDSRLSRDRLSDELPCGRLVKIAEIAMIGTTGSAPTSGTSTSGIRAPVP
jgi:hypothetical protein